MPVPRHAKLISRGTLRDKVYETLLGWIMEGELRPGEKLLDFELAERLGVSRTPVREALRRLEDRGLVATAANRWTRVTTVSMDEVERVYPLIWSLEALAVELAIPRLGRAGLARLAEINRELESALAAREPVRASRADASFHQLIIDATRNPELIEILAHLKMKLRRLEVLHFEALVVATASVREHAELIAALDSGQEPGAARDLLRRHWQGSLSRLRQAVATKPEERTEELVPNRPDGKHATDARSRALRRVRTPPNG